MHDRANGVAQSILAEIERNKKTRREATLKGVAKLVDEEMRKQGMSQLQLAALSGNSASTITRLLKGLNICVGTLADVFGAMGLRLKLVIVKEEEDK
jgi:transcriptional regulator with XRE-family HTH domain